MFTLAALQRMSLGLKLFHFRSIKGFCVLVLRAEQALGLSMLTGPGGSGISTIPAGRRRWMRLLPSPLCSCHDARSGRQDDLLVSCPECLFLLQPRHLHALRLLLFLLELSERILLLPYSIPSCPPPIPLAHLELGGLQKHLERSSRNRKQKLDRFHPMVLLWEREMWWRSFPWHHTPEKEGSGCSP